MTKRCKADEKCDPSTDPASSYSFGLARRRAGAALNAVNLLLRKRDYLRAPATMGIFDKFNTAFGNSKVCFIRASHRHSATVRVVCAYNVVNDTHSERPTLRVAGRAVLRYQCQKVYVHTGASSWYSDVSDGERSVVRLYVVSTTASLGPLSLWPRPTPSVLVVRYLLLQVLCCSSMTDQHCCVQMAYILAVNAAIIGETGGPCGVSDCTVSRL